MEIRLLVESEIRALVGPAQALAAVRDGFVRLAHGQATLPGILHLDLRERQGEVHVKGAYLHGTPYYSIKEATGFYRNPEKGLPVGSGVVLVFDATTGFLRAILLDNGYLTELRTGAAGALAADLLARREVRRVGLVGCGTQARYQIEALLGVRRPAEVLVYGRRADRAAAFAERITAACRIPVRAVATAHDAVQGADVVVTVTPARSPLVRAEWIAPGTQVTAVGSDGPDKQELQVEVLARADRVVADRLEQCLRIGEIHHAVAAGALAAEDVVELGAVAAGTAPGRTTDDQITVADLTGVGVQDAAVANVAVAEALRRGVGRTIEV